MDARSEPEITMRAVKLDRDGNPVEEIPFHAEITPAFLARLKQAARDGWQDGQKREDKI